MGWRYRVLDLPPGGTGAFMPIPATIPSASSWGLVVTSGSPGTDPIPAPAPQRDWLPTLTKSGGVDSAQGSNVAPDVRLPDIYVAWPDNMGPEADVGLGMAMRRLNPIPIPARHYARQPVPAQARPRIGGRSTMPWPRAFQRYPATTCPT